MTVVQAQRRYESDPVFHALVGMIYSMIEKMELTPGEARDAAMLASLQFEMRRPLLKALSPRGTLADPFPLTPCPPGNPPEGFDLDPR